MNKIGRYEIQSEIGRGGFGQVFKATDPGLGRTVAIKVLTAMDADLLVRFQAEATATARLQHPNIVTIYEFGEQDNAPFIAMEYLAGMNLQRMIAGRTPLTLLEKVRIMLQVAAGLQHAHKNGVIHRDVKPANILVLPDGQVKIMDFGIARVANETATRLTQQGSMIGTLLYMSPEQFGGHDADALSDIFAYGVTFYQFISGTHPFQASEMATVMHKVMNEQPRPLTEVVPDCPPALDGLIAKALAKNRDLRYQSFTDLQLDMQVLLLDLEKEKSSALLNQANGLVQSGQFVQAQSVVGELLEFDPQNPEAQRVRAVVDQAFQRLPVRERIEANLKVIDALLANGDYSQAMSSLESALALYPEDADLLKRLNQGRRLQEQQSPAEGPVTNQAPRYHESESRADHTVLVDPKSADLPPPVEPFADEPLGDATAFFSRADLDAQPPNAYVTVVACPDPFREGLALPVKLPRFTIGRNQGDLTIPEDKTLSRTHAVICWNGAGFTIQDAGTPNGTYLNGIRLDPGRDIPLPLHAEIRLSVSTRLRFRCDISELPDFTGQKLVNRYNLERCLRAGRKSALYEGSDTRPIRKVAVKLLSPNLATYPGYLEQFEREAQSAAGLSHPNICRIYEHGRAPLRFPRGGTKQVHYVCMQMLEGGSLAQRLDDPSFFTPDAVAAWLDIVASALDDVHRNGVVHSGLKPTSIVFNATGVPYVTDFAIATRSGEAGSGRPMFGAPEYLSPEQWDGLPAEPASDQYSLACLCYRVLTGVVPFDNQLDHVVRGRNLAQGAVPAHLRAKEQGRPPLSESISAVLAKAMSVRLADRYPSISDFARAFRETLDGSPTPARKPVVFVSYRREADAGWAALFADKLTSLHGLDVFVDRHRVDSARQVPEKIASAIRDCDYFVCLLARTTLQSAWVREEIRIADAAGKPMIPVVQEGFRRPAAWNIPPWLRWLVPGSWLVPECARRLMDAEEVRLFADYDQGAIEKLAKMILFATRKPHK